MILSNRFMVGDDDVLFVMIILERKLLRLELVQLTIENIALIKEKFRKIKVHIRVNLTLYRNTWNLNLVILFSWKLICLSSCNELWKKKRVSLCIKRIQSLYKFIMSFML